MDYVYSFIFAHTDEEDEEFEGFTEEDVKLATKCAEKKNKKFQSVIFKQGVYKGYRKRKRKYCRKHLQKKHYKFYYKESKHNQKRERKYLKPDCSGSETENCNEKDYLKSWIFRDTDDEDEEFEGFTEEDLHSSSDLKGSYFEKKKNDRHFGRENNGSKHEVKVEDETQRHRKCFSNREREEDKDEDMFSNDETDGETDVKWYSHVMQVLESSIENDDNCDNDQRILRQNLNKVFGINKNDDIMLKIFVKNKSAV